MFISGADKVTYHSNSVTGLIPFRDLNLWTLEIYKIGGDTSVDAFLINYSWFNR